MGLGIGGVYRYRPLEQCDCIVNMSEEYFGVGEIDDGGRVLRSQLRGPVKKHFCGLVLAELIQYGSHHFDHDRIVGLYTAHLF